MRNNIATWSLPRGVAANKCHSLKKRMSHYRFQQKHLLNDGTRIVPTIETMRHIFDANDMFQLPVAISANSYTIYVNDES